MIDIDALKSGNRRALGKAITLLESSRTDHRDSAEQLLESIMPYTGNSIRIGITGVPGVGKSSFIEVLGNYVVDQGQHVAVLTIDPSSSLTGGSILGDKTRMETLSVNPGAFIRPSPSQTTLGGVARRTQETILLCEAAGFDVVIVETVGVGQSETLVANMTDVFLLMLLPGGGDELQGIKRGIMELADIAVVNKADGEFKRKAIHAAADVRRALQLIQPRLAQWRVPVEMTSALDNTGIEEVWQRVCEYREILSDGCLQERRQAQSKQWFWSETREHLLDELKRSVLTKTGFNPLEKKVMDGTLPPSIAASKLVTEFLKHR
ncbi:MAG: methylmalonyl Co-A mutase-associated GTPase MeaB [Gammaproteobacteria bacterium]|nr:methylmalonyl Co-A mutase-associated GTPase MeaB [Gammaproteobacteria bacterium]NKB62999.1 methylmalonyl Co-A mutase-associated GTPase MeaB [Gammaproteobacteria bacterium]